MATSENGTYHTMEMVPLNTNVDREQNGLQMPSEREEEPDGVPNRERSSVLVEEEKVANYMKELNALWGFLTFGGIVFCMLDMGSDIYVAVSHFSSGSITYFYWTLAFVVPSSVITNILSLLWYIETCLNPNAPRASTKEWIVRAIFLIFQLGPVLRYIDTFRFGRKSKNAETFEEKERLYKSMTYEREDAALIRLFECFLETAPQMVLQIFIMADPKFSASSNTGKVQYASVAISLAALSFALVSQQRATRSSQGKGNSWDASFLQFWSQACLIFSRVLTFGWFASYSLWSFSFFCAIHFAVMTTWVFLMDTSKLSSNKFIEAVSGFLFGIAYIFFYVNLEKGDTRWRRTVFHLIIFSENVILISVWYMSGSARSSIAGLFQVIAVTASYVVGLLLSALYYKLYHPSGKINPVYCFASSHDDDNDLEVTLRRSK